jgi:glycogen synthase
MTRFSIAFGTRELWPFVTGGGIGRVLHGAIRLLAEEADVTVITRDAYREEYERMREAGDPRLPHPDVRFAFIADPEGFELAPFSSFPHCWSALMYERLCELYPDGGPDLVEFNDYLGEGFVTIQARRSDHPSMRKARVVVGLHTSLEMIDALDEKGPPDEERRSIYTLERGSIAHADVLRCPAQAVLDGYARFYGADHMAPGIVVPHVIAAPDGAAVATRTPPPGYPTRLLFVGRLQRVKGAIELVEAATRLDRDGWELTLLGGDTDTAPGGGSMREHLVRLAAGDERIVFHDRVPVDEVLGLIDRHHVVVTPSLWECWSAVAREALSRNRPVLVTPRGGLPEAVEPGVSGWLTEGTSAEDIERTLRLVLDSRDEIDAMIVSGGPQQRLRELIVPETTLERYREMAARGKTTAQARGLKEETVSAVVTCSSGAGSLRRTLDSLAAQRRPVHEVVLVSDGIDRLPPGFDPASVDVLDLLPAGAGAIGCRNAGFEAASGSLVLLVDAGTELHPRLLERLLEALRDNPGAGYATAWAHGLDPSAVPLGNFGNLVPEHENAAATPLVRREVLEGGHSFDPSLGACAGRAFYAGLAEDGIFGCVVPERLASWVPFSAVCADETLLRRIATPEPSGGERVSWVAP